jgi:hypothetical protein
VLDLNPNVLPLVAGIDLTGELRSPVAATIIRAMIYGGHRADGPAQRAIAAAMLKVAGVPLIAPAQANVRQPGNGVPGPAPGSPTYAAAVRFAGQPAPVRHAWLAAHLPALRAGRITLAEIP